MENRVGCDANPHTEGGLSCGAIKGEMTSGRVGRVCASIFQQVLIGLGHSPWTSNLVLKSRDSWSSMSPQSLLGSL